MNAWVVAGLAVGATVSAVLLALWLRARWPRWQALREIGRLERAWRGDGDLSALYTGVSRVLRRAALRLCAAPGAAGLSGEAWLAFLDGAAGTTGFQAGPGRILATAPFEPGTALRERAGEEAEVLALVRSWLRRAGPARR
jgi:Ca-activated chloride channel family protein